MHGSKPGQVIVHQNEEKKKAFVKMTLSKHQCKDFKHFSIKDLLYNTWNYIQYLVITSNGK